MNLLKSPPSPRVTSSDMTTAVACTFVFAAAIVSYAVDHRARLDPTPTVASKEQVAPHAAPTSTALASRPPADQVSGATPPSWTAGWTLRGALAPEDNPLLGRESRRLKTMLADAG